MSNLTDQQISSAIFCMGIDPRPTYIHGVRVALQRGHLFSAAVSLIVFGNK